MIYDDAVGNTGRDLVTWAHGPGNQKADNERECGATAAVASSLGCLPKSTTNRVLFSSWFFFAHSFRMCVKDPTNAGAAATASSFSRYDL